MNKQATVCMTPDDLHYKLLGLLQEQPDITQRQLAISLGISLGRINDCVQALIGQGWVKAAFFRNSRNKRAYLYTLTPRGMAHKADLTLRYLRRKECERQQLVREIKLLRKEVWRSALLSSVGEAG